MTLLLFSNLKSLAVDELELKAPSWAELKTKTILKGNISESNPMTGIGVIGLRFIHKTGYPTFIEEVYPNSPAEHAGIQRGNLIVTINGIKTNTLNPDAVYELLSGAPGSRVQVQISQEDNTLFTVTLIREDLANFSDHIQKRYLTGPIAVPFDFKDIFPFH
ncbi:MAG: PDZ domain-containing protein [Candidatus Melainabacteria bacterium]|nr:PDZ domain-containing protein [Candidatus Melainabacteria bacterium]